MNQRAVGLLALIVLTAIGLVVWLNADHDEPLPAAPHVAIEPETNVAPAPIVPALETSEEERSHIGDRVAETKTVPIRAPGPTLLAVKTVARSSNEPLSGMRVSVWHEHVKSPRHVQNVAGARGSIDRSPLTDEQGRAELEVPAGEVITVSAHSESGGAGYESLKVPALADGERREVVLAMRTGNDVHFFGRVLAREGLAPIAGASVDLELRTDGARSTTQPSVDPSRSEPPSAMSDAAGRFEITTASWRSPHFGINAPGFSRVLVIPGAGHETRETALDVVLDRSATLDVHVVDRNGVGLSGIGVRLKTESYRLGRPEAAASMAMISLPDPFWRGATDATGRCVIEGLPPDVPLTAELSTARPQETRKTGELIVLHPGEVRRIEWKIGVGCMLTGTAVDQHGKPVTGMTLWLRRASGYRAYPTSYDEKDVVARATTNVDGRYGIDAAPSGSWLIGPAPTRTQHDPMKDDAIAPLAEVLEIQPGVGELTHDLVVHRGLYIRGNVLDPSGAAIKNTYVNTSMESGRWSVGTQSSEDGSFAAGPLVPGQYQLIGFGTGGHAKSDPVRASAGDEGVVVQLKSGAALTGKVVDAETSATCSAKLVVSNGKGVWLPEAHQDGIFRIAGLEPGLYDIAAGTQDSRAGVLRGIELKAGDEVKDAVLRVSPGARVRVRYAGKASFGGCRALRDGVLVGSDGIENGTNKTFVVPPGRIVVEFIFFPEQRKLERVVDLAVGEEKEVAFDDGG